MSGQEPDIERRLLLAIVLSMAILVGLPYFLPSETPPPPPAQPQAAETSPSPPAQQPPAQQPPAEAAVAAEPQSQEPPPVEERRGDERRVVVENNVLRLTFDTKGAVLDGIELRGFDTPEGEPVQLLPPELPRERGRPLQLAVADEFLDQLIGTEPYALSSPEGDVAEVVAAPVTLRFEFATRGLAVTKTVHVPEAGYELRVDTSVTREGRDAPHRIFLGPGLGPGTRQANDFADPGAVFRGGDGPTHIYEQDLEGESAVVATPVDWAGVDSKYFALVLVSPALTGLEAEKLTWNGDDETAKSAVRVRARVDSSSSHRLFAGPKRQETLAATEPSLREAIDYGWFAILVEPLLFGLKYFYAMVGNYGWAIILLTFVINLALFPLRYKQIASMSKMSALQPKLKSIQDKYKRMKRDDPRRQQMNAEVMALYKQHGVNPLGGCLPLVFQMPILFAFYQMLNASIELRGAPFLLWIQDLSQPDPYLVTPALMGATMVLQQKMTPSTADPAQKRMMMFLPIIFTFMFLWVSSGLALYFLFSNVFAMMFQFLLQTWKPELVGQAPKAAKKKRPRGRSEPA